MATNDGKKEIREIKIVSFIIDNEKYAVTVDQVLEVVPNTEITPIPMGPEFILGLVNIRGNVLPIVDIEKRFNLNHSDHTSYKRKMVIFSLIDGKFGVVVDDVIGVQTIFENDISEPPPIIAENMNKNYIRGVIIKTPSATNSDDNKNNSSNEKISTLASDDKYRESILLISMSDIFTDYEKQQIKNT